MITLGAEIMPPEGQEPFPQAELPLLLDEQGCGWVPHAFRHSFCAYTFICRGVGIAWWPAPEIGGAVIAIAGGNPAAPTDESVVASVSREGLRRLIADLQSIHDQLEPVD